MSKTYPHINDDELFAYLAANDFDEISDGAWFCTLENAVDEFNRLKGTKYDRNDAVHAYLESDYASNNGSEA